VYENIFLQISVAARKFFAYNGLSVCLCYPEGEEEAIAGHYLLYLVPDTHSTRPVIDI
jgi:hypothetical protein